MPPIPPVRSTAERYLYDQRRRPHRDHPGRVPPSPRPPPPATATSPAWACPTRQPWRLLEHRRHAHHRRRRDRPGRRRGHGAIHRRHERPERQHHLPCPGLRHQRPARSTAARSTFTTSAVAPTVTTQAVTAITATQRHGQRQHHQPGRTQPDGPRRLLEHRRRADHCRQCDRPGRRRAPRALSPPP